MKLISIEIDYEGNASVETVGLTGKGGAALRDAICKALGLGDEGRHETKREPKKSGHPRYVQGARVRF
jgi:hypothetical protein